MITCERIPPYRVRQLDERWSAHNAEIDYYVPKHLRMKLTDSEKEREYVRIGEFINQQVKNALPEYSDEETLALCLGVPRKARGAQWLSHAVRVHVKPVWVDVSSVACTNVRRSLSSQRRHLVQNRVITGEHEAYSVMHEEIRNFFINYREEIDKSSVRLTLLPLSLGYLPFSTAEFVLETIGGFLSEARDSDKQNRILVVGQLRDNQDDSAKVRDNSRILRFWPRGDILSLVKRGAGRKVEVLEEHKTIYFEEVVTALTIGAK